MTRLPLLLLAAGLSLPALAQTPATMTPAATPTIAQPVPGTVPTAGNPNLAVASVKLEHGTRASKIIGSTVTASDGTSIGTVDDLIMTQDDRVTLAVIGVGGFAGVGAKLVAVPFDTLKHGGGDTMVLPGQSRDTLNAMPNFVY